MLYNRRLRVRLRTSKGTVYSKLMRPNSGLPQGGILSPLLWIIFIRDFEPFLEKNVALFPDKLLTRIYADDITLLEWAPTLLELHTNHSNTSSKVKDYCSEKPLHLCTRKCKSMVLNPPLQEPFLRGVEPRRTRVYASRSRSWETLCHLESSPRLRHYSISLLYSPPFH